MNFGGKVFNTYRLQQFYPLLESDYAFILYGIACASCIPAVFAHLLLLTFWPLLPLLFLLQVMAARHLRVEHLEINLSSSCTCTWRIQWVESNMDRFISHLGDETITGPSSGLSCLYISSFRTSALLAILLS